MSKRKRTTTRPTRAASPAAKQLSPAEQEQREKKAVLERAGVPRERHDWLRVAIAERGGIEIVNYHSDPLREYKRRRLIDDRQYDAGIRIAADWALFSATGSIDFDRIMSSSGGRSCLSERQAMALDRFDDAMDSVSGQIGKRLVLDVCCFGYTLSDIPSVHYHRRSRDAWPRLLEALDELCIHYGTKRYYEIHTINKGLI